MELERTLLSVLEISSVHSSNEPNLEKSCFSNDLKSRHIRYGKCVNFNHYQVTRTGDEKIDYYLITVQITYTRCLLNFRQDSLLSVLIIYFISSFLWFMIHIWYGKLFVYMPTCNVVFSLYCIFSTYISFYICTRFLKFY